MIYSSSRQGWTRLPFTACFLTVFLVHIPLIVGDLDIKADPWTSHVSNGPSIDDMSRKLGNVPCGEQFTTATKNEIIQVLSVYAAPLLQNNMVTQADLLALAGSSLKHDVVVSKVCLSCADVVSYAESMENSNKEDNIFLDDSPFGFQTYCGKDSYGYNAVHSALVFAPADPNGGEGAILPGKLRGFVFNRSTKFGVLEDMTLFPQSIGANIQDPTINGFKKFQLYRDYAIPLLAASKGAVSIMPDNLGYGESVTTNRPYMQPTPYMQAITLSWLATEQFLLDTTCQMTRLDSYATITGYSEGGYASIVGALALKLFGVRILSAHVGGVPFDLNKSLGYAIGTYRSIERKDCINSLVFVLQIMDH